MTEGWCSRRRCIQQLGNAFQQCTPAALHQPAPQQLLRHHERCSHVCLLPPRMRHRRCGVACCPCSGSHLPRGEGGRRLAAPSAPRSVGRCSRRPERGVEVFMGRCHRPGWPSCPAVRVSPWVAGHRGHGASASRLAEKKLRRTPTRRAKCRMWGSGKTLKVRTLGCARSSFRPTDLRPSSLRSCGRTRRTSNTERHEIYTGSGHR